MKPQSVVIIGGGGCGASVLAQFVEGLIKTHTRASITLIGRDERFGPGLPYGTEADSNILNMKGQAMGLYAERPLDFAEWVRMHKDDLRSRYGDVDLDSDPFPPRSLFGLYLEDSILKTVSQAKDAGISVHLMHGTVIDVQETVSGVEVKLSDGAAIQADHAVLALGNFPSTEYQDLKGAKGYFHTPWLEHTFLDEIGEGETVCILGSRLTAVDTALMLAANGHRGQIVMISRNGLLPKVQGKHINPAYQDVLVQRVQAVSQADGSLRLQDFVQVLREEIERVCGQSMDWQSVLHPQGSGRDIFLEDIAAAESDNVKWQDILASTSNVIEDFWHQLVPSDRQHFMRTFFSLWFVYRHAMPIKSARKIAALIKSRQLTTRANPTSVSVNPKTGMFDVECSDELRTGNECISTRFLINATGEGLDVAKIPSELLQNLLRHGMILPNPCGGIEVGFKTCNLIGQDGVSGRMYALGSLTRGTHFYTNDIHRNAVHAKRIVDALIEKLHTQPSTDGSIQ